MMNRSAGETEDGSADITAQEHTMVLQELQSILQNAGVKFLPIWGKKLYYWYFWHYPHFFSLKYLYLFTIHSLVNAPDIDTRVKDCIQIVKANSQKP